MLTGVGTQEQTPLAYFCPLSTKESTEVQLGIPKGDPLSPGFNDYPEEKSIYALLRAVSNLGVIQVGRARGLKKLREVCLPRGASPLALSAYSPNSGDLVPRLITNRSLSVLPQVIRLLSLTFGGDELVPLCSPHTVR